MFIMGKKKLKNIGIGILFIFAGFVVLLYNFYPIIFNKEGYISFWIIPAVGVLLIIVGLWYIGLKIYLPDLGYR